jgi:hypothetical protein
VERSFGQAIGKTGREHSERGEGSQDFWHWYYRRVHDTQRRSESQRLVCITVPIHFLAKPQILRLAIPLTSSAHLTQVACTRTLSIRYTSPPELTASPTSQPPSTPPSHSSLSILPASKILPASQPRAPPAVTTGADHKRTERSEVWRSSAANSAEELRGWKFAQRVRSLTRLIVPR